MVKRLGRTQPTSMRSFTPSHRLTSTPSSRLRRAGLVALLTTSTLGLGCLLVAVAVRNPEAAFVVRAASIGAFMLLTTAVGAHVIARAAARGGAPLWKGTVIDERPPEMTGNRPPPDDLKMK